MSHIVNLSGESIRVKTNQGTMLHYENRICKAEIPGKNEWIYFKFIKETPTSISGIRLQQDQYDNNKFYVTDEKNKWHGIITDGTLTKGRWIYVYK
jgi:hypothetical protein